MREVRAKRPLKMFLIFPCLLPFEGKNSMRGEKWNFRKHFELNLEITLSIYLLEKSDSLNILLFMDCSTLPSISKFPSTASFYHHYSPVFLTTPLSKFQLNLIHFIVDVSICNLEVIYLTAHIKPFSNFISPHLKEGL